MSLLQRLIEALRNELQQNGEMLALLDHQQKLVRLRGADDILYSISAINDQSSAIEKARGERHFSQQQLAQSLAQPEDSTLASLIPLTPECYQPLVFALVQENNELLLRVRQQAQHNQDLLQRSLELMRKFIHGLSPEDSPETAVAKDGMVVDVPFPEASGNGE